MVNEGLKRFCHHHNHNIHKKMLIFQQQNPTKTVLLSEIGIYWCSLNHMFLLLWTEGADQNCKILFYVSRNCNVGLEVGKFEVGK